MQINVVSVLMIRAHTRTQLGPSSVMVKVGSEQEQEMEMGRARSTVSRGEGQQVQGQRRCQL